MSEMYHKFRNEMTHNNINETILSFIVLYNAHVYITVFFYPTCKKNTQHNIAIHKLGNTFIKHENVEIVNEPRKIFWIRAHTYSK